MEQYLGNVDLQDGSQLDSIFNMIPFRNFSLSLAPVLTLWTLVYAAPKRSGFSPCWNALFLA